ncbi:hypothetical protein PU629_09150 [Pullulanibacillus sp. KACC 23026]|nr:hypothetical protein [Pullulanibacillus sp. KACC 23026]WEG14502.1 hypothetical protein PU629_09150 [Pullulanibacillus sp. KACC 23026]
MDRYGLRREFMMKPERKTSNNSKVPINNHILDCDEGDTYGYK